MDVILVKSCCIILRSKLLRTSWKLQRKKSQSFNGIHNSSTFLLQVVLIMKYMSLISSMMVASCFLSIKIELEPWFGIQNCHGILHRLQMTLILQFGTYARQSWYSILRNHLLLWLHSQHTLKDHSSITQVISIIVSCSGVYWNSLT